MMGQGACDGGCGASPNDPTDEPGLHVLQARSRNEPESMNETSALV
jgi:hypothetical protein